MKPHFAIIGSNLVKGFRVLTVDTAQATFQGIPWRTLGDFGKRKFENILVFTNENERLKIIYA